MLEEEKTAEVKENEQLQIAAEKSGGDFFTRFSEKAAPAIKKAWQKLKNALVKAYSFLKESLKKAGIYIKEGYLKLKPKVAAFCKAAGEKTKAFFLSAARAIKHGAKATYTYLKESLKKAGIYIKESYLKFKPKAAAFCKTAASKLKTLFNNKEEVKLLNPPESGPGVSGEEHDGAAKAEEESISYGETAIAAPQSVTESKAEEKEETTAADRAPSVTEAAEAEILPEGYGGQTEKRPSLFAFTKRDKNTAHSEKLEAGIVESENSLPCEPGEESSIAKEKSEKSSRPGYTEEQAADKAQSSHVEQLGQPALGSAENEDSKLTENVWSGIKEFFKGLGEYFKEMGEAFQKDDLPEIADTARKKRLRFQALVMAVLMLSSAVLPTFATFDYTGIFAKRDTAYYCERADKYIQKGDTEKAASYIEKAEALASNDEERVKITLVKASYAFATGDGEQGLKLLEEYLVLMSDDDASRAYIAQYYVENNMFNEALIHYSVLIRRGYATEDIYYLAGVCAMNAGKYLTAEENFTYAAALGGETKNLYYYRGVCRMYLEKYASAADDFTVEMSFGTTDKQTLCYYRGLCYLAENEYTLARDDLKYAADEKNGSTDTAVKAKALLSEYFTGG